MKYKQRTFRNVKQAKQKLYNFYLYLEKKEERKTKNERFTKTLF